MLEILPENIQIQMMKIDDFLEETQPLSQLVSGYIELEQKYSKHEKVENKNKETSIINSILIGLAEKKNSLEGVWNEIKYTLEVNSSDRDCLRRGAQLLLEIVKRSPSCLTQAKRQSVVEILSFSCEKAFITICGNDFIALIEHVTTKIGLDAADSKAEIQILSNFALSNKLQISTYRQQTRLNLYKILLKLLKQGERALLQRSVKAGQGEKDPRNIGSVFEIYLFLLDTFSTQQLSPYQTAMFENLQAYYPIEFVSDEDNTEHQKVNLRQIAVLLDKCLCHPFFAELTWELLSAKTAAAPLGPFISTILAYLQSLRKSNNLDIIPRLSSLLIRFGEQEFIAEEYEEHAEEDLSTVIQRLVDIIFCREDNSFSLKSLEAIKQWLELMVGKATQGQCKHSGSLMGIFKAIIDKRKVRRFHTVVEMVRSYSLKTVLKTLDNGEIIPKLGLAVVVVTGCEQPSVNLRELLGLLVLKVGSLYETVSDELKLLLLKILIEVYRASPSNHAMVRKVNDGLILKDSISKAEKAFSNCPTQNFAYIIKSYIDYITTVYFTEVDLLIQHISGTNFELQSYLLVRLWEGFKICEDLNEKNAAKAKIGAKISYLLSKMSQQAHAVGVLKALKVINQQYLVQIIQEVQWLTTNPNRDLIFTILLGLKQSLRYREDNEGPQNFREHSNSLVHRFVTNQPCLDKSISIYQELWRALGMTEENSVTFPILQKAQEYDISLQIKEKYLSCYPPTFVQFLWERLKNEENYAERNAKLGKLLCLLPETILLRDRDIVLSLLLKSNQSPTSLLKIAKSIDISTIRTTGILEYCLQSIEQLAQVKAEQYSTERGVCVLATLISILERDKSGQFKVLIKNSQRKLKQLKLHKKRPIRQAIRRLLSFIQD